METYPDKYYEIANAVADSMVGKHFNAVYEGAAHFTIALLKEMESTIDFGVNYESQQIDPKLKEAFLQRVKEISFPYYYKVAEHYIPMLNSLYDEIHLIPDHSQTMSDQKTYESHEDSQSPQYQEYRTRQDSEMIFTEEKHKLYTALMHGTLSLLAEIHRQG